ncbi:MAG TPA: alpha/beta hydrolase [Gordonia sp. (in: high G+C Gram-positive bacteria)]|uniref:alpha/beta hydrolase n=1 Tax=unclassified Gordonia (in: high G+C Gram-positive bacteria) TaxID=2657482 RepID=UPI000FB0BDFB|nr:MULTISPECIES: alpha/beta hydrolase [unclassified Gordonia (in: high G+C Gram-positive bacteria)]RUP39490.1 MAG: alpha/beta hydrolase [Gordonia sp. (in: high G+C Gram-positive bacteria)]HNP55976.1 alpha/beta hydrolase [Gordonia sp. (in: high G+C Gram-positive bacteria)]HRC49561.1 alpha/beta hydrolase [Gordonia sp. (in: high G+C Gram-positive bacteria)]
MRTGATLPVGVRMQRTIIKGVGRLPAVVRRQASVASPINTSGDRLDPYLGLICQAAEKIPAFNMHDHNVVVARKRLEASAKMMVPDFAPFTVEEDLVFDGPAGPLRATRYRAGRSSLGLVVFYHGGGWTLGSRASHVGMAKALAADAGVDVLSVEYRLAPEHPFPAAYDDAMAAWRYAVSRAADWGLDPHKIGVAGDSAGGNLAAVVAQQTRGDDVVPAHQLLIYPAVDLAVDLPSKDEFASGRFLTREHMDWFVDNYIPDPADRGDLRASPLRAEDFSDLPPAHVVLAGFDPLRDEGIAYAEALRDAGVPVTVDRVGPMCHGFLSMTMLSPEARDSAVRAAAAVADALR